MSNKNYTPDQIEELLRNPYIAKCSPKYITYTYECKEQALRLHETRTISSRDIFRSLGFPLYITESHIPKDSIKAWKRIVSKQWLVWLKEGKRWRKKKEKQDLSNMSKDEYIIHLETQVASMKEVQDFLRKRGRSP